MIYEKDTWPVKEDDVITLQKNDGRMVKQKHNVRPDNKISLEELSNILQLHTMGNFTEDYCFGQLKKVKESFSPLKLLMVQLKKDLGNMD